MKEKQKRRAESAKKEALREYIRDMEDHCYVWDPIRACPDCVCAYEHTVRHFRQTFKENP